MHSLIIKIIEIIAETAFPAIVFSISCRISHEDIISELKRPQMLIRAFIVGNIVVPLIALGLVKITNLPYFIAEVMLLASIAPGDSFALMEAESKKGSLSFAAVAMILLSVIMPVTIPLWLWIFRIIFHEHIGIDPLLIAKAITPLTIMPLICGVLLKILFPKASVFLFKASRWYSLFSMVVLTLVTLVIGFRGLFEYTPVSLVLIFILVSSSVLIGFFMGGKKKGDGVSMAVTVSLGNLAVVILIAHHASEAYHPHMTAIVVAFVIFRWLIIMFWHLVEKAFHHAMKNG